MSGPGVDGIFASFARTRVMVVGDVMVDAYLWGQVERISPEAPVPVVRVTQRSARLGGAANVALNLHALGAAPVVVSMTGNDAPARQLDELFKQAGLSTDGLLRSVARTTTVKTRVISGHQHVVRVDEENDADLERDDGTSLLARIKELIARTKPQVIVLEDYDKGVLTAGVIAGAIKLAHAAGVPVAVDPKKRNFFAYRGVDLFKPNLKELREGLKIDLHATDPAAIQAAIATLEAQLKNKATLVTLGEHGVVASRDGRRLVLPAHVREIADVSGAGDTVIAVAALCLAQDLPLDMLAALANLAGGLVCEHVGVVPIDRARFLQEARGLITPE